MLAAVNPAAGCLVNPNDPRLVQESGTSSGVAPVDESLEERFPGGRDDKGYTPLHWAASNNNYGVAEELLSMNGDPNDCENEAKQTPLHVACAKGNRRLVALLLRHDADLEKADSYGYTAATLAAQNGHVLLLHYLRSKGADTHVVDHKGCTLLHWAAYQNHHKMVRYLLKCELVDPNISDAFGATALHWASVRGNMASVSAMVELGASCSVKDHNGLMPSELAAKKGYSHVKHLLQAAIDQANSRIEKDEDWIARPRVWWGLFFAPWVVLPLIFLALAYTLWFIIPFAFIVKTFQARVMPYFSPMSHIRSPVPYGLLLSLLVVVEYTFFYILWPYVSPYMSYVVVYCVSKVAMLYFLYRSYLDPGYVPFQALDEHDWSEVPDDEFCSFCVVRTPVRSRHCRRCDRCVSRFDHHCVFINNCVGSFNHHHFLLCIWLTLLNHMVWLCLVTYHLFYAEGREGLNVFGVVHVMGNYWDRFVFLYTILSVLQFFGEITLVYIQTKHMLKGMTMSDAYYGHGHGDDASSAKLYDKGIVGNVKEFFQIRPVDWTRKYSSSRSSSAV